MFSKMDSSRSSKSLTTGQIQKRIVPSVANPIEKGFKKVGFDYTKHTQLVDAVNGSLVDCLNAIENLEEKQEFKHESGEGKISDSDNDSSMEKTAIEGHFKTITDILHKSGIEIDFSRADEDTLKGLFNRIFNAIKILPIYQSFNKETVHAMQSSFVKNIYKLREGDQKKEITWDNLLDTPINVLPNGKIFKLNKDDTNTYTFLIENIDEPSERNNNVEESNGNIEESIKIITLRQIFNDIADRLELIHSNDSVYSTKRFFDTYGPGTTTISSVFLAANAITLAVSQDPNYQVYPTNIYTAFPILAGGISLNNMENGIAARAVNTGEYDSLKYELFMKNIVVPALTCLIANLTNGSTLTDAAIATGFAIVMFSLLIGSNIYGGKAGLEQIKTIANDQNENAKQQAKLPQND